MKYQKINVQVLPQTPVVRAAIGRFCSPNSSRKVRHAAIRDLTTMVTGSIGDMPSYSVGREGARVGCGTRDFHRI